jgi:hypothetical protein
MALEAFIVESRRRTYHTREDTGSAGERRAVETVIRLRTGSACYGMGRSSRQIRKEPRILTATRSCHLVGQESQIVSRQIAEGALNLHQPAYEHLENSSESGCVSDATSWRSVRNALTHATGRMKAFLLFAVPSDREAQLGNGWVRCERADRAAPERRVKRT